jgi:hypothetical protein
MFKLRFVIAMRSVPGAVATGFQRGKRLAIEEATRSPPLPVLTSWRKLKLEL